MSAIASLANGLYAAAALPARRRLQRALGDPGAAQRAVLTRILRDNADCEFGRAHGFASIRSAREYRARVAPRSHEELGPQMLEIAGGRSAVLTSACVRFLEPSGGSSGATKLVPYTDALLAEFSEATMPWVFDLLRHRPALRSGRAYWAVSPPARRPARSEGGLPIGMEHDSDYFPPFARALLDRVLGTPRALSRAPDIATCRYLTLRALLALPDLAFVSVWSPSFLTLLASALDEHFAALVRDIELGSIGVPLDAAYRAEVERALPARPALARELRLRFGRRAPEDLGAVWPRLALISCWTDAHAARALAGMRRRFPSVEVQGKGLLATEGVISVPLFEAAGCVAAVTSHFLEFVPEGTNGETLGVEELETGSRYEVLLTTSGGLYRYRLHDVVRVEGWHHRTPLLSFVGRADRASDLAGEKLTPAFAEEALRAASRLLDVVAPFAMLAPRWEEGETPCYVLYADCETADATALARAVEEQLLRSHHYSLCRSLGQLGPVRDVVVRQGERAYERVCLSRGQRAGSVKPAALDAWLGWGEAFGSPAEASTRALPGSGEGEREASRQVYRHG